MKKQIGMIIMTFCVVMLLAFALPGMANAESLGKADAPSQVADVAAPGRIQAKSTMTISSLRPNFVSMDFSDNNNTKEIQLLNKSFQVVQTTSCMIYGSFSLKKNQVYYLRFREKAYDYNTHTYVYSGWSGTKGICTVNYSLKLKGGKVRYKAPKVKGVKKFKIYLSKKSGSGYKKIKTLKPGKSFSFKKFKGKKIKKYKNYYYYSIAKAKNGANLICPAGYWWVY